MADAVETSSDSTFKGNGNVSRKEKLTLRVAATVVEELPNGVLRIEGQQEVRVNYELRELIVTGYVRPIDISRQNEITYDKIAGARISYGGRGQITEVQQPRYGQQVADISCRSDHDPQAPSRDSSCPCRPWRPAWAPASSCGRLRADPAEAERGRGRTGHAEEEGDPPPEYVKLNNQFVVPLCRTAG
jgi:hypothetical protein